MTNEKRPEPAATGRGSVGERWEELRRRAQANAEFTRPHLVDCDRPGCQDFGTGQHEHSEQFPALHTALELSGDLWDLTVDWSPDDGAWVLLSTFNLQQDATPVEEVLAATRSFESALVRARGRIEALNGGA